MMTKYHVVEKVVTFYNQKFLLKSQRLLKYVGKIEMMIFDDFHDKMKFMSDMRSVFYVTES